MNEQRFLLVVSGPSGSGKDTVVGRLIEKHPEIELSVSATTRAPRPGEKEGEAYHYVSKEDFEWFIAENKLLEYASYVGNYYGTLKSEVDCRIFAGTTCVLVIEVEGAAQIKEIYPECTTVFLMPPSEQELERRLRNRGTETEERIQQRMTRAREEMALAESGVYDFRVVNRDVEQCADEIYRLLSQRQAGE